MQDKEGAIGNSISGVKPHQRQSTDEMACFSANKMMDISMSLEHQKQTRIYVKWLLIYKLQCL